MLGAGRCEICPKLTEFANNEGFGEVPLGF